MESDQNPTHLLQRLPLSHCAKDIKETEKIDLDQIENNLRMRKKCRDAEYHLFSASIKRALLIESLFLLCVSLVFSADVVDNETVVKDTAISLIIDSSFVGWIIVSSETL